MIGDPEFVSVPLDGGAVIWLIAEPAFREQNTIFGRRHNALNIGVHVAGQIGCIGERANALVRMLAKEISRKVARYDIRFTVLRWRAKNQDGALPSHHFQKEIVQGSTDRSGKVTDDVLGVYEADKLKRLLRANSCAIAISSAEISTCMTSPKVVKTDASGQNHAIHFYLWFMHDLFT